MKKRCTDTKSQWAHIYVGKGIKVCDEWQTYTNFRDWALKNGYNDSLSIDRINNDGDYEPSNCRWATNIEQSNNTSRNVFIEFNGKKQTIRQWERELGFPRHLIQSRLKRGWTIEQALTTPKINPEDRRTSDGRYSSVKFNNDNNQNTEEQDDLESWNNII